MENPQVRLLPRGMEQSGLYYRGVVADGDAEEHRELRSSAAVPPTLPAGHNPGTGGGSILEIGRKRKRAERSETFRSTALAVEASTAAAGNEHRATSGKHAASARHPGSGPWEPKESHVSQQESLWHAGHSGASVHEPDSGPSRQVPGPDTGSARGRGRGRGRQNGLTRERQQRNRTRARTGVGAETGTASSGGAAAPPSAAASSEVATGPAHDGRKTPKTSKIGLVASLLWSQVPKEERQVRLQEAREHLLASGVDVEAWPPHRRLPVWDPIEGRVIKGAGAPKVQAAERWFARHPYFYVHLPTLRQMFGGEVKRSAAGPGAERQHGADARADGSGSGSGRSEAEAKCVPRSEI